MAGHHPHPRPTAAHPVPQGKQGAAEGMGRAVGWLPCLAGLVWSEALCAPREVQMQWVWTEQALGCLPTLSPPLPHSRAGTFSSSRYGASVPIPVPTQVHNYQRIEQNLQSPSQHHTPQ